MPQPSSVTGNERASTTAIVQQLSSALESTSSRTSEQLAGMEKLFDQERRRREEQQTPQEARHQQRRRLRDLEVQCQEREMMHGQQLLNLELARRKLQLASEQFRCARSSHTVASTIAAAPAPPTY